MTDGMIRCVALLRALDSDPIKRRQAPPPRDSAGGKGSLASLLVVIASLTTAMLLANAWAADLTGEPATFAGGDAFPQAPGRTKVRP